MEVKERATTKFRYKQLQEFENEINWTALVELIAHHYVESGIGRLLIPVESMIRVYFLQLRYNLNSNEIALALAKIDVLRDFALIDLKIDAIPEEDSVNDFANLIEDKSLKTIFEKTFNIFPMI